MIAHPAGLALGSHAIVRAKSVRADPQIWRRVTDAGAPFVVPLTLALLWEWAVWSGHAPGRLMPPPSRLARHALALTRSGELPAHAVATMTRVVLGAAFGTAAGTALGTITGTSALARRALDPSVQALRAIPSIAWVPLFVLWLGIFEAPKIALVALGVFFPVYLGVLSAIQGLDKHLMEVGRVCGLSRVGLVRHVVLPAITPQWVTAVRMGVGLGFMFVLAAELLGASEGLGYLLLDGQQLGRADTILVAMISFAALGKVSDSLLLALTRPMMRWQDHGRTSG